MKHRIDLPMTTAEAIAIMRMIGYAMSSKNADREDQFNASAVAARIERMLFDETEEEPRNASSSRI